MSKFRKKPIVIEAWRADLDDKPPSWVGNIWDETNRVVASACGEKFYIATMEGPMTAKVGDWIIQGVRGEVYACDADIFAETYEAA